MTLANCTQIAQRPSAKAGHIPSWRKSYERYALSPVAAVAVSRDPGTDGQT